MMMTDDDDDMNIYNNINFLLYVEAAILEVYSVWMSMCFLLKSEHRNTTYAFTNMATERIMSILTKK